MMKSAIFLFINDEISKKEELELRTMRLYVVVHWIITLTLHKFPSGLFSKGQCRSLRRTKGSLIQKSPQFHIGFIGLCI